MFKKLVHVLVPLALLTACDVTTISTPVPQTTGQAPSYSATDELRSADQAERAFVQVLQRLEPVAESECRSRTASGVNCDFRIVVDDRANQPANAYQTLDKSNRPVIVFTLKLIQEAYNADEIAFVMGHEAAHHIAGHIARQRQNAVAGAVIFGGLATLTGGDVGAVESAQRLGEQVGSRTYSKEFELEADALGTIITHRAGYNPLRGAEFFTRIPDPGNRFLGTHPPNASRMEIVRRTAAAL